MGRKRVERLMRRAGLQGAFLRRKCRAGLHRGRTQQTVGCRCHPDPLRQGAFWLAAVRDAFSNRIVGWKTSDRGDTDLVLGALEYAIWSRDVRDGQLIHHSDRGSTYTAFRFSNRLADNVIAR